MTRKILFAATSSKEHRYTWDYIREAAAVAIVDLGSEQFALVSSWREVDDDTGATGEYRDSTDYLLHLYSKHTLVRDLDPRSSKDKNELITFMKTQPWGADCREVERILLSSGRISIVEGSLVLES